VSEIRYSAEEDYYELFGLAPTATADEIARAHKRLAKEFHPDVHPDKDWATERFKLITHAYTVLKDPVTKGEYDRRRWAEVGPDRARREAPRRSGPFRRPSRGGGYVDPDAHHRDRYMAWLLLGMEVITLTLFLCLGLYAAWRKLHG
jgi:curved DNA-binding protein CbpA